MLRKDGQIACDICGGTGARLVNLEGDDICDRCKARLEGYDKGARDLMAELAELMLRALAYRGLKAVDLLRAARKVEGGPLAEFLAILERGDTDAELKKDQGGFEREYQVGCEEAELFAASYNYASPHSA